MAFLSCAPKCQPVYIDEPGPVGGIRAIQQEIAGFFIREIIASTGTRTIGRSYMTLGIENRDVVKRIDFIL
jgi:hypothetical protein